MTRLCASMLAKMRVRREVLVLARTRAREREATVPSWDFLRQQALTGTSLQSATSRCEKTWRRRRRRKPAVGKFSSRSTGVNTVIEHLIVSLLGDTDNLDFLFYWLIWEAVMLCKPVRDLCHVLLANGVKISFANLTPYILGNCESRYLIHHKFTVMLNSG